MEAKFTVERAGKTFIEVEDGTEVPQEIVGADIVVKTGAAMGRITTVQSFDGEGRLHVYPKLHIVPDPGDVIVATLGDDDETVEEAREPQTGDCFITPDGNTMVILADKGEMYDVALLPHRGLVDSIPWTEMQKKMHRILRRVAKHHVVTETWKFYKNVEDRWAK